MDEHTTRCNIPFCTFGVDANLLHEIEAVNQYSKILEQNCVNFGIMDRIKSYICTPSTEPLVVYGKSGCGKSVLSAKVAQNIHQWLPNCSFVLRYTKLTPLSSDIVSIVGSIAEQVCYLTKGKSCIGPHVSIFTVLNKNCFLIIALNRLSSFTQPPFETAWSQLASKYASLSIPLIMHTSWSPSNGYRRSFGTM